MDRQKLGKKIKLARVELDLNQTQLAQKINAKLTILEMKNRVKNLGNGRFAKLR